MKRILLILALINAGLFMTAPARAGETEVAGNAKVWIIWPKEGMTITGGKFWLRMGIRNAGLAPAGIKKKNTGHHHVLVNTELPAFDDEIVSDRQHLHFGGGQSEARIELPPGKHTIQLILGDFEHVPTNPPLYSQRITVIVP